MENYLAELEQLLHQLHHSDKEEAMNFYREYVMDADLVTYEQCISELGTPKQLSRKILADYSIKADEKSTDDTTSKNPRSNIKLIWWIALALLASPLALPVFIVLVTLAAVGFAVLASFIAVVIALTLSGVVSAIIGVSVLLQSIWTGLYYIGCGLLILGIMLTVMPAGIGLLRWLIDKTVQLSKAIYRRFTDKKYMHREDK
ncbi:DUF1700 domain-containing protein [Leuconostoc mesenteroides]|uniref:DUF1700 domain-containing protein n=1 Tax=Leuconostoc mesenteroides TaxID=1245 RepID=UPI000E099ED7|nr:DUF1700 domain-containing protein [Leuconostoc mesenteroides]RDF92309.1 hypothetical protein DQM09_04750 [Leuconostoc mesenteroides subsp. mesenteroides]